MGRWLRQGGLFLAEERYLPRRNHNICLLREGILSQGLILRQQIRMKTTGNPLTSIDTDSGNITSRSIILA